MLGLVIKRISLMEDSLRKGPFLISIFSKFFFYFPVSFFFKMSLASLGSILRALSPAGRSPNNKWDRRWDVRLIKCRK